MAYKVKVKRSGPEVVDDEIEVEVESLGEVTCILVALRIIPEKPHVKSKCKCCAENRG